MPMLSLLCLQFLHLNLFAQTPTLSSFSPANGAVGTLVTITGTNLSNPSSFTIGGQAALIVSNSGTSLVGMVMPGAVSGGITVTTAGGSVNAAGNFDVTTTLYPNSPQSDKLVGSGSANMRMGNSASISADGSTAILGAWGENTDQGAAFVFIKTAGVWSEQVKLVGTGNIGAANQGNSVAISADGNTAIVGGPADNGNIGAAWVFTRSGGIWTQQSKLVGTGNVGTSHQGWSISISADGNTAIMGGYRDNTNQGAAWIFTRTAGIWTQQGNKIVGSGGSAAANQGHSVSISANGNTALMGGPRDNGNMGASWIFVRSGNSWSQQGSKLVGTSSANSQHGDAVALSADGNTAVIGGYVDNGHIGSAWFFTRTGTTWSQQGDKITSGITNDQFASAVGISADGNTALIGAPGPNALLGATATNGSGRVYTRKGDLWTLEPYILKGSDGILAQMGTSAALSADGKTGILGANPDNSGLGAGWTFTHTSPPVITSFSPQSGPVGTLITITGSNLLNPTALMIGGKTAIAVSNTGTNLVAMLMPDAVTGELSVSTTAGTAISSSKFTLLPTLAPNTQQGAKLVGTDNIGSSREGASISISADGNTAVAGALFDNSNQGAAWVYTRLNGTWSQQAKLVGLNNIGAARQGGAVSISADGNTIIIGGNADNGNIGAAWVFTRTNGVWSEQTKLIATGNIGNAGIGTSVSISADGNTAILGGTTDNTSQGAAWIFTRRNGVWTQKTKLIGTGNTGAAHQGGSVFISADANTAILGGYSDDANKGAAWIFTQTAGTWTQQGNKLVGTGTADPTAMQGTSVSLSADGNTAIVGGPADNGDKGATWVYTRVGAIWSQQGTKLLGNDFIGSANQGYSVTLSADGNVAMVGGYLDNGNSGATWVYTRSAGVWSQQGNKIIGTGNTGNALQGLAIALSSDGKTGIVGGQGDNSNRGASWAFYNFTALPTISSFTPNSTGSGNTVTINGTNFIAVSAVSFGGINAKTFQVVSSTSINAVVPDEAVSGSVSVTAAGGTATLAGFTLAAPSITSFSPSSGSAGTLLKIIGTNLGGLTAFSVGGKNVVIVSNTGTELAALVMPGSRTGLISLSTNGGTADAAGEFRVLETPYPTTQQGNKLIGTNIVGNAQFGYSIAVSADGNTAAIGAINDNTNIGGVWIYTRSGNVWTQQGNKLVGSGNTGISRQGRSVALSADGNTVLIGGNADNSQIGAAWVFTRTAGVWTQQGNKLLGTNAIGAAQQGFSVALSADGNTALVGARFDNSNRGAVWVYIRTNGVWSQQGNKLVATDSSNGSVFQGYTTSLSADGNTAIVGGYGDNSGQGAAWIYTRTGNVWSQQGNKLVGTGNIGAANQATSVAISADGNTAISGGPLDNTGQGASWVFTRTGGIWSQEGNKLVGTGNIGAANQGRSVSLSADGNTATTGAHLDDTNKGAIWAYTRQTGVWTQQGTKFLGSAGIAGTQGVSNALSADGSTLLIGAPADNTNIGAAWVFSSQPIITSFNPTSAGYGEKVTISGKNLSPNSVSFGGTAAISFNSISINSIEAIVGGGSTGIVSISSPLGTPTLAGFTFLPPVITSFTPTSQSFGNTVTITGTNLTGATAVSFGGTPAASFNVVSSSSITAVLAAGTSGIVSITTPGGTTTLPGFAFLSSNADLSNFSLSTGTSAPVFNSGTIAYTADVPYTTGSIKVIPTKTEANASIKINGNTVISGNSTADINLSVGINTINIIVTAQDGVTTKTYTLTVTRAKENQTISFSPLATKVFGDAEFSISATGGASGVSPMFSSSNANVATINGSTVTIKGAGSTVITASQQGNTDYNAAADVTQTLTVVKATQSINFTALPSRTFGDATFNLSATGGASGNAISYTSSNPAVATIAGSTLSIIGAGTSTITASQEGNANFNAATDVSQTLTVNKAAQSITFNALPSKTYGDPTFELNTSGGSSGNAITYTSSIPTVASIIGSTVTIHGAGTSTITASQSGNTNYHSASASTQIITVSKAQLTITPDNKIRVQGAENPVLSASYTGFVRGDNSGILLNQPILNSTATSTSPPGEYPITASGASALNYTISYLIGKLTVSPPLNIAPTNISLTKTNIDENNLAGTIIGILSSTDADAGNTFNYSLINGSGSTDNSSFSINGNELRAGIIFDYETKPSYSIRIRTMDQGGLSFEKVFQITINDIFENLSPNQAPSLNSINNQIICYTNALQSISLNGISAGPETTQTVALSISSSDDKLIKNLSISQVNNGTALLTYTPGKPDGGIATIIINVKDDGGTANGGNNTFSRAFTITINALPEIRITSNLGTSISKGLIAQLSATGGQSYIWANAEGIISGQNSSILMVRPSSTTTYKVTSIDANGCSNTQSITLNVEDDYQSVKINNIMSPNGDGRNDLLVIKNLDMYPSNTLKIFSKTGREIYTKINYTNDWDATINGSPLAEDTYYYILDFGQGLPKLKGFVSIVR